MKTKLLTAVAIAIISCPVSAQTKWDKHGSTQLEDDCMSYLTKTFKGLDETQKETISLCFAREIKTKYANRDEYEALSDRELSRLKSTYISQCAKNAGLDLKVPEARNEEKPNKDNLIGKWKDDESEFYLNPDGSATITFNDDGSKEKGTWSISNDLLTLMVNRKLLGKKQKDFKIFMFSKDRFLYQSQKTMQNSEVTRLN